MKRNCWGFCPGTGGPKGHWHKFHTTVNCKKRKTISDCSHVCPECLKDGFTSLTEDNSQVLFILTIDCIQIFIYSQ